MKSQIREYRKWTDAETTQLYKFRKKNMPYSDIALALNKPITSCYTKYHRMKKKGQV